MKIRSNLVPWDDELFREQFTKYKLFSQSADPFPCK
jgi:hypothetical protein